MSVDSNKPYQRVNVQANHNDTIWNGAAWGAGAGIGAVGLTYGTTTFGAKGLDALASKVAGNKTTRMQTRNRAFLGSKKRMAGVATTGLMGGMLAGAAVDHYK